MFRPSSVSAWGTVRTVPKRTTPLVRQQHLWRPRPSVPRCVRCCLELLPFQCSRCGGGLLGQSQRMPYLVSQGDTFRVAKSSNNSGRQNGDGHGRRLPTTSDLSAASTQNRRLVPTDKQNVRKGANRKPRHCLISHFPFPMPHGSRGIVGTTVERTKMKPSITHVAASLLAASCAVMPARAGMAPKNAPDLPENFCPKATGVATATTGECMCNWQDERGCTGSGCKFEMGLSWYHYMCEDCECVPEPKKPRKKKR